MSSLKKLQILFINYKYKSGYAPLYLPFHLLVMVKINEMKLLQKSFTTSEIKAKPAKGN